jgi:plastocyanin
VDVEKETSSFPSSGASRDTVTTSMRKPTRARRLVVIAAVAAFALLGACGGDDAKSATKSTDKPSAAAAATSTDKVSVKNFQFGPKVVSVKAGSTVTWTNEDAFDHSIEVTSLSLSGPKFGPQTMPTTYSHQFDQPGTYSYFCGVHNSMTGTVIVTS